MYLICIADQHPGIASPNYQFLRSREFLQPSRAQLSGIAAAGRLGRGWRHWFFAICAAFFCVATSCAQEPKSGDQESVAKLISEASRALQAEDFDRAAQFAKQAAQAAPDSSSVLQSVAETLYLSGFTADSIPFFDRVVELSPESAPHNWQRGIALCTHGDFKRGAEQFKQHHDVNPDDVENSAWYFLCIAKTDSLEAARKTVIPSRGDGRQPMMTVLKMLKGEVEPAAVIEAAVDQRISESARPMAQFYADLYVGLYFDSIGDAEQAAKYLKRSGEYGRSGYMVRTAKVYLDARFPTSKTVEKSGNGS